MSNYPDDIALNFNIQYSKENKICRSLHFILKIKHVSYIGIWTIWLWCSTALPKQFDYSSASGLTMIMKNEDDDNNKNNNNNNLLLTFISSAMKRDRNIIFVVYNSEGT